MMAPGKRCAVVESPWAHDTAAQQQLHQDYLRAALADAIQRGESPIASHGLLTQVLDDAIPEQRRTGLEAGLSWVPHADVVAVYTDLGISTGMQLAIDAGNEAGVPVEYRTVRTAGAGGLARIMDHYRDYERAVQEGPVATYACPGCGQRLHHRIPRGDRTELFRVECPHCGDHHERSVQPTGAVWLRHRPSEEPATLASQAAR